MKKILISILMISGLIGQVNRLLTLSPTAQTSAIGNVMLPMMNPARNHINTNDGVSFSKVNWLTSVVNDMNYTFVNLNKNSFGANVLFFNYGEQLETDLTGVVTGNFSPSSSVWSVNWGGKIKNHNVGVTAKFIQHDLYTQKTHGAAFDIGGFFPKVYKDLDIDVMMRNFGFGPTFGTFKTNLPTSLNVSFTYPYKQFMFYEQHNLMKNHRTHGSGVSYNYKNMLWGKLGYYSDKTHKLNYPTFGVDLKYDKYLMGMSYIYGDKTLPLSNTIRLTINMEI